MRRTLHRHIGMARAVTPPKGKHWQREKGEKQNWDYDATERRTVLVRRLTYFFPTFERIMRMYWCFLPCIHNVCYVHRLDDSSI